MSLFDKIKNIFAKMNIQICDLGNNANAINVRDWSEIPKNFTGKVEFENRNIYYLLNGKEHRLDGPAKILYYDYKQYCINGKRICDSYNKDYEQYFYNSKEYKQWILLENMKKIKNIT